MLKNRKSFFIIFFFLINTNLHTSVKENIIKKLIKTESISFSFIQKINGKIEIGNCILLFPKKLKCIYEDDKRKELIVNGNILAVNQKRYGKVYHYPIKKSFLNKIINKKDLFEFINLNDLDIINDQIIIINKGEEDKKILIFFDLNNFDLKGWKFSDQFNNKVEFLITIKSYNKNFNLEEFNIPKIPEKN